MLLFLSPLLQYDLILVDVEGLVVVLWGFFFPNDSRANSHDCCHVKHHLWFWLGCAMFQNAQCMSNSSDCGSVLLFHCAACTRHISLRTFLKAVSWLSRAKAISLTRFACLLIYRSWAGENPHSAWFLSKQMTIEWIHNSNWINRFYWGYL